MFRGRTAPPSKLCFNPSIFNEDSLTDVIVDILPQSSDAQTTEASWILRLDLVVALFQDFIGDFQTKFAEMQEDTQREGTILYIAYIARVDE